MLCALRVCSTTSLSNVDTTIASDSLSPRDKQRPSGSYTDVPPLNSHGAYPPTLLAKTTYIVLSKALAA